MYSFSYLEPVHCFMPSSNCCFLTCIQIFQEAGQVVWYSHLFKNFPQFVVIHTVKGFAIVNKAEIEDFSLWESRWELKSPSFHIRFLTTSVRRVYYHLLFANRFSNTLHTWPQKDSNEVGILKKVTSCFTNSEMAMWGMLLEVLLRRVILPSGVGVREAVSSFFGSQLRTVSTIAHYCQSAILKKQQRVLFYIPHSYATTSMLLATGE